MEDRLEFLAPRPGGGCALGCSAMNGRCWSGSVWLYSDPLQAPDVAASQASYQMQSGVPCAAWVSRDMLAVGADGGHIEWLDAATDTSNLTCSAASTEHTAAVTTLAVTCDGERLISGDADASVCVLDCRTQQRFSSYRPAHGGSVTSLAAHPDHSAVFASAGLDGNVLMWDTRQAKPASSVHRDISCPVTTVLWQRQQKEPPTQDPPESHTKQEKEQTNKNEESKIDDSNDTSSASPSPGPGLGSLLLGTINGSLMLCCPQTREVRGSPASVLRRQVTRLVPCPERPQLVAVCGNEETLAVASLQDDSIVSCYSKGVHTDLVRDVIWLSQKSLLSCGWDKKVIRHELPPP